MSVHPYPRPARGSEKAPTCRQGSLISRLFFVLGGHRIRRAGVGCEPATRSTRKQPLWEGHVVANGHSTKTLKEQFARAEQKRRSRASRPEHHRNKNRTRHEDERIEALTVYSGGKPRCSCECGCSESRHILLDLDHVNNDGAAHRESLGLTRKHGSRTISEALKKAGWPKDPPLRVLCVKCHIGRHRNGGQCPELGILPLSERRRHRKKLCEPSAAGYAGPPTLFDALP